MQTTKNYAVGIDPIEERLGRAEDIFTDIIDQRPSHEDAVSMIQILRDSFTSLSHLCGTSRILPKINEKLTTVDLLLSEGEYDGSLVLLKTFLLLETIRLSEESHGKGNASMYKRKI